MGIFNYAFCVTVCFEIWKITIKDFTGLGIGLAVRANVDLSCT